MSGGRGFAASEILPRPLQVLRSGLWAGAAWEEDAATFYLDSGDGNAATVIYDYRNVSGGLWGA